MIIDPAINSALYALCVAAGMFLKRYVIDIVRDYIINKLKPGIIQDYLEEVLGCNAKKPLPPFVIMPIQPQVQEPAALAVPEQDNK